MSCSRRSFLGQSAKLATATSLAGGLGCLKCFTPQAYALALQHDLRAVSVFQDTYVVYGETENFNMDNGGNIVNVAFVDTTEGVVLIDSGPSYRYAKKLKAQVEAVTGKPVVRVYMTHHHPDHMLGNQVYDPDIIMGMPQMIRNMQAEGEGFSDNMYRLVGDWMRGTELTLPGKAIEVSKEIVGSHEFEFFPMAGHTSSDLVIRDNKTGVLFSGDLAFLDRAPTTPHADVNVWLGALKELSGIDHKLMIPGHGPADANQRAVTQTRDYLQWLTKTLTDAVDQGYSMTEAMQLPIDPEFASLGVVHEEYQRSVAHLYADLEEGLLPIVSG